MTIISVKAAASKLRWPVEEWKGNCYAAACEFIAAGLVPGEAEYGLYLGPVQHGGYFNPKQPMHRHGWIRQKNGNIVDPTRWVFEVVAAYIAVISADDERQDEYDLAGHRFRRLMAGGDRPPPEYTGKGRIFTAKDWEMDGDSLEDSTVCFLLGPPPWDIQQMFWLGNRSPMELGDEACDIYEGLIRIGCSTMIPIDFCRKLQGLQTKKLGQVTGEENANAHCLLEVGVRCGRRSEFPRCSLCFKGRGGKG